MKLTAVILAKNEEENIEECLKCLKWCDEILVIDDESTDRTIEIAKKENAKVYKHLLNNNFAAARNFGLERARNDWVLFVDADERISEDLARELESRIMNYESGIQGYYLKRLDIMRGTQLKHGETGNIKLIRLAKKDAGKWFGKVHEQWRIKGQTTTLDKPILHYPHQNLTEFLTEINFYTELRARELFEQKVKVDWWDIILYPKGKFLKNYIVKAGFLDGTAGLVFALMMSFHSFLVRGKLWQMRDKQV